MRILEEILHLGFGKIQWNKRKKYIIVALFAFVAATILFYGKGYKKEKEYKSVIENLNNQIEKKEDSIVLFEKEVEKFEDRIDSAEQKIEENKGKIKTIYKGYEVQVITIDSYDIDELEQFFAKRYPDSLDNK